MVKTIEYGISLTQSGPIEGANFRSAYNGFLSDQGLGSGEDVYFYKYNGVDIKTIEVIKKVQNKIEKKKKKVIIEKEYTIELGGVFEEIGGKEENVGGGNQKTGNGL